MEKHNEMDYAEIAKIFPIQPRSNYQILNFVINQHDTPEMKYRQIILEGQSLISNIEISKIESEKIKITIDKLESSNDEIDNLDAKIKKIELNNLLSSISAMESELEFFKSLFENSKKYSPKEVEQAQEAYWKSRLNRQAELDQLSRISGIGVGNLDSMLMSNIINREEIQGAIRKMEIN
jgi:hypothetical protein